MAFGAIAQLVARFHGMEEVAGSIPASSTNCLLMLIQFRASRFCFVILLQNLGLRVNTLWGINPVFAHNLETVPRLMKTIRPAFRYDRFLSVTNAAKQVGLVTKSNLILGMGGDDGKN